MILWLLIVDFIADKVRKHASLVFKHNIFCGVGYYRQEKPCSFFVFAMSGFAENQQL